MHHPLATACLAEAVGTFFLVFFGTGSVYVAVLTGALQGLYQVAIIWGLAIAISIFAASALSGAHFNPAVTLACWAWRGFPARRIVPYLFAQLLGAILAAAVLYGLFHGILEAFELKHNIVRGAVGSEKTALLFGEYFPHPYQVGVGDAAYAQVSLRVAMLAEAFGTAILVSAIFALTDSMNANKPNGTLFALFIGLTVTVLICIIAPLTQAGFNPARDFGPRLFAWLAGWGSVAIPGPRGGFFTVYILAPIVGGIVGGGAYDLLFGQRFGAKAVDNSNQ